MDLRPLLQAYPYLHTEAPPTLWEADSTYERFLPLLGDMLAAALKTSPSISQLTLSAANVVVPSEALPERSSLAPPAGEFIAISVTGPGPWTADWRWLPEVPQLLQLPLPVARLEAAGIRFAYGRFLGQGASMTVFLARHRPGALRIC